MNRRLLLVAAGAIAMLTSATPAAADPCKARLPSRPGEAFAGQVRYVGDGDSLCVGRSADPAEWIEVRLADFDAPELASPDGPRSKALLTSIALGRATACTAEVGRSGRVVVFDRVIASCRIGGLTLGSLLRAAGAPEGGR